VTAEDHLAFTPNVEFGKGGKAIEGLIYPHFEWVTGARAADAQKNGLLYLPWMFPERFTPYGRFHGRDEMAVNCAAWIIGISTVLGEWFSSPG
jgi:hypothetical protein